MEAHYHNMEDVLVLRDRISRICEVTRPGVQALRLIHVKAKDRGIEWIAAVSANEYQELGWFKKLWRREFRSFEAAKASWLAAFDNCWEYGSTRPINNAVAEIHDELVDAIKWHRRVADLLDRLDEALKSNASVISLDGPELDLFYTNVGYFMELANRVGDDRAQVE